MDICNNKKKNMILNLGEFILKSNLEDDLILIKEISDNLKNLKKNIYDLNRIISILNSYKNNKNNLLKEYCNYNLNEYDIFIKEKNFKYTEKNNVISIDSNILDNEKKKNVISDNLDEQNDQFNEFKNIKRYYINKKNPFIAEYSNETI